MRLLRFIARKVHGFLNFDLEFNIGVTFLTGINGSGKTSALNGIIALTTPDLAMLASLDYEQIAVFLEYSGQIYSIQATSQGGEVNLSANGVQTTFKYLRYIPDSDASPTRQETAEAEFYRDLLSSKANHPVFKVIANLPTPMFLGIDRRATLVRASVPVFVGNRFRYGKNVFNRSLLGGLHAAARLAEESYRDALIQGGRYSELLQQEMLLGLLGSDVVDEPKPFNPESISTRAELKEVGRVRKGVDNISRIMGLPTEEVRRRLFPVLDKLEELASKIPVEVQMRDLYTESERRDAIIRAYIDWNTNQHHLRRIKFISETVEKYNDLRASSLAPTRRYQKLVNQFLKDSGKEIWFNEEGYISVKLAGVGEERPISSLSSGEAQIFTILTHLSFNPLAERDNVFIIDEPELSLHVQWQEMFVDSVMSANPNIQYIMATHSPSIILERVANCIDIVRQTRKN